MVSYSYCALRYLHNPSVGEVVNIGVLIYAPEQGFVAFRGEQRTKALSQLFGGFDRDDFLKFLNQIEASVKRFQNTMNQARGGLFEMEKFPENAEVLARWLIADQNLSFQFGTAKAGVTRDLEGLIETVFNRMVRSQRPVVSERKRRDEEAVWNVFQNAFREHGINRVLSPHVIQTPAFDLPFDHAFKNERWHAIEPISFDYARREDIRDTAMHWYSYGAALSESDEFSQLYLLLGAPTNPDDKPAYEQAKRWLAKMPGHPILVEESEAEEFANTLATEMKQHGVLRDEDDSAEST